MTTPRLPEFIFDEEEKKLIKSYVKDSYNQLGYAADLRKRLENRKVIDESTTYDELSDNEQLMEALLQIVGESLPNTIAKSKFGLGKFTDLEIFQKARNDDGLNALVNGNVS